VIFLVPLAIAGIYWWFKSSRRGPFE